MPMLRVSTTPIIASFRKAMVAVDRLYPTRSAMLVNTTGPPLGYNLASVAMTSRSLYDRLLSISFITFIVKTPLLSLLLDYLMAVDAARLVAHMVTLTIRTLSAGAAQAKSHHHQRSNHTRPTHPFRIPLCFVSDNGTLAKSRAGTCLHAYLSG